MAEIEIKNEHKEEEGGMKLLAYRMEQAELAIKEGFKEQAHQIQQLVAGFVTKEIYEEAKKEADKEHKGLQKQIDDIKKDIKWVVRLVLAAVIGAVLALVFVV